MRGTDGENPLGWPGGRGRRVDSSSPADTPHSAAPHDAFPVVGVRAAHRSQWQEPGAPLDDLKQPGVVRRSEQPSAGLESYVIWGAEIKA